MCKPANLAMTLKLTTWFLAGFILLFGLTFFLALAARASPGDTLYVQTKNVNVYESPSTNTPVVMQVIQDQKLKEFRRQGEWVKVIIYGTVGKEGWIEGSFVGPKSVTDMAVESQEPEEATIVGAIEPPKPEAKSLLHKFVFRATGSGRIKGDCRYKTANGAIRRFKIGMVNMSYRIRAKAISCNVSSPSVLTRLRVQLWGDGNLLVSDTIRSGANSNSFCQDSSMLPRTCAQSTRRQLSAYW